MKVFFVRMEKIGEKLLVLFLGLLIAAGLIHIQKQDSIMALAMLPVAEKVIVIDPGHGGFDPGKTGNTGENEKDINLKVALKLQQYLEQGGATVLLTRNEDTALGDSKQADMKERKEIADTSQGDIFISIHQNAYTGPGPKGAQTFYHNGSAEGKRLAEAIQSQMVEKLEGNNQRQAKANMDYYLLKKPQMVSVIVECGFISNPEEEKKLNSDEYQEELAWAIYLGILDYFQQEETAKEESYALFTP